MNSPSILPTVKVIGFGNAGCAMVGRVFQQGLLSGAEFLVLNTDQAALASCPVPSQLCIGLPVTRGLGTGGDVALGRSAAQRDAAVIRAAADARLIFVVVGLGGGSGTGGAPVFARLARESGALVLAIATTPFEFEGGLRRANAETGLQELRAAADAVIVLPNHHLARLLDERTPVTEAFRVVGERAAEAVTGLWRMLAQPGILPVDFAGLERLVRGRHAESAFASVEISGEARVHDAVVKLASHPCLDEGRALARADALILNLAGGPELSLAEIDRASREIGRLCRDNVEILVGTSVDEALAGRLRITVIPAWRADTEVPALPLPGSASSERRDCREPVSARTPQRSELPDADHLQTLETDLTQSTTLSLPIRASSSRRGHKSNHQPELNLFPASRGRFDNTPATIHNNENLDEPTFRRRNLVLN
ncbi:MAG: hypothetical protein EXS36_07395 [Pedosphaera sp.]|nr:hypothetical protein [Pedosphaera sp.]